MHLLTSVQYSSVIYFSIQQQSGTQREINCQVSERVTEQKLSQEETELINETKNNRASDKKKNVGREREKESNETSLTNSWLAVMGKDGRFGDEEGMR